MITTQQPSTKPAADPINGRDLTGKWWIIDDIADAVDDAWDATTHWVGKHRCVIGQIFTVAAVGACTFASLGLCAGVATAALVVRTINNVVDRKPWQVIAADATITAAGMYLNGVIDAAEGGNALFGPAGAGMSTGAKWATRLGAGAVVDAASQVGDYTKSGQPSGGC